MYDGCAGSNLVIEKFRIHVIADFKNCTAATAIIISAMQPILEVMTWAIQRFPLTKSFFCAEPYVVSTQIRRYVYWQWVVAVSVRTKTDTQYCCVAVVCGGSGAAALERQASAGKFTASTKESVEAAIAAATEWAENDDFNTQAFKLKPNATKKRAFCVCCLFPCAVSCSDPRLDCCCCDGTVWVEQKLW